MRQAISKAISEEAIDDLLNAKYRRDGAGVDMAALQGRGIPRELATPSVKKLIREIEKITGKRAQNIMVNRLLPGVSVPKHVDDQDYGERWHLPVATNDDAWWWDEDSDKQRHMKFGYWVGPVPYRRLHQVGNDGTTERIHLIVDVG